MRGVTDRYDKMTFSCGTLRKNATVNGTICIDDKLGYGKD